MTPPNPVFWQWMLVWRARVYARMVRNHGSVFEPLYDKGDLEVRGE